MCIKIYQPFNVENNGLATTHTSWIGGIVSTVDLYGYTKLSPDEFYQQDYILPKQFLMPRNNAAPLTTELPGQYLPVTCKCLAIIRGSNVAGSIIYAPMMKSWYILNNQGNVVENFEKNIDVSSPIGWRLNCWKSGHYTKIPTKNNSHRLVETLIELSGVFISSSRKHPPVYPMALPELATKSYSSLLERQADYCNTFLQVLRESPEQFNEVKEIYGVEAWDKLVRLIKYTAAFHLGPR